MKLSKDDIVVTAWAEEARGRGYVPLVWVLVRDGNGKLRIEAVQRDDQTPEMLTLFNISADVSIKMAHAASGALGRIKR